jgi:hypothetical protein
MKVLKVFSDYPTPLIICFIITTLLTGIAQLGLINLSNSILLLITFLLSLIVLGINIDNIWKINHSVILEIESYLFLLFASFMGYIWGMLLSGLIIFFFHTVQNVFIVWYESLF